MSKSGRAYFRALVDAGKRTLLLYAATATLIGALPTCSEGANLRQTRGDLFGV